MPFPVPGQPLYGVWTQKSEAAADFETRWRPIRNILDYGAVVDTDCTVAIQTALDAGGRVVCPDPGVGHYYGITSLIIRAGASFATSVQFIGDGGRVTLKYLGTAAAAASMIVVDKTTYNAGNNYKDIAIEGFVIDGNNLALKGLDFNGFTRRCSVKRTYITGCVCPAKVISGYYSLWEHVEFGTTPLSCPAGMNAGVYAANLYGVYLDTCQLARFSSCIFYTIGGDAADPYIAALRVGQSDGIKFDSTSFEAMQISTHKLNKLIILAGQTTLKMSTIYLELVETVAELIQQDDNTILDTENWFLNGIVATSFLRAVGRAPIRIGTLDAENVDFSTRLFDLSSGTEFTNLSIDRISFGVGAQVSTQFDANTTVGSKKGVSCSPILLDNKKAVYGTGYVTSGYTPSLGATFVDISSGTAFVNGQPVGFSKNSGVSQRLYPDLSLAGTWNIMVSPAGTPYIEIQSAVRAESTYALRIGTFTTPGGAGAPAGLLTPINSKSRINGASVDVPKSVNTLIARQLSGWVACPTTVATDMFSMTLSPSAGQDDCMSAVVDFLAIIGAGANRSVWRGFVTLAFTQDNSPNRVSVTSAVYGDAKALDASVATWTLTFAQTVVGNVSTLKATSTPATGETIALEFTATIKGGAQTSSTAALAAAATVGE